MSDLLQFEADLKALYGNLSREYLQIPSKTKGICYLTAWHDESGRLIATFDHGSGKVCHRNDTMNECPAASSIPR